MFGYHPLIWWLLGLVAVVAVIVIALLLPNSAARLSELANRWRQRLHHVPLPWRKNRRTALAATVEPPISGSPVTLATLTLFRSETIVGVIKCPIDGVCEQTIGRSATLCDQVINDSAVSRCHVRVVWEPQGARWYVEDLGSKNGTQLDGQTLRAYSPAPLEPGARLTLGGLELTVTTGLSESPPASAA